MKHTPGPWVAYEAGDDGDIYVGDCETSPTYPTIVCENCMSQDARLIAAAPDLLNLIKQAFFYLEEEPGTNPIRLREEIYNVIKMAEGRSD